MLNENIRALRKEKGLSQEELAIRLNVVRQTVSKWEQGLSVPDAVMLTRIAGELDTSVNILLGEEIPENEEVSTVQELAEKLEALNTELARRSERNRKIWRGIFAAVGLLALAGILHEMLRYIHVWRFNRMIEASEAIIGGADGPTAMLVSSIPARAAGCMKYLAAGLIAAVGVYCTRRR